MIIISPEIITHAICLLLFTESILSCIVFIYFIEQQEFQSGHRLSMDNNDYVTTAMSLPFLLNWPFICHHLLLAIPSTFILLF